MSTTYPTTDTARARVIETSGGATESMGGVAVVILAILSLVDVVPRVLTPVAGIIFGAAFIVEGAATAARESATIGLRVPGGATAAAGGVTIELVVGFAAIVLGVLALIGLTIPTLMGALVIVGGAGLVMSAGLVGWQSQSQEDLAQATGAASGAAVHLLAGLAAIVLGILALTNATASGSLVMVGLLVLGASLALNSSALSNVMLRVFQHR